MPKTKSAMLRYWVIDRALLNERRRYPNRATLLSEIEQKLGYTLSESMLYKDLHDMKLIFGAPITYCRNHQGYYYDDSGFSIRNHLLTEAEINALKYVSDNLSNNLKASVKANFKRAIQKIILPG